MSAGSLSESETSIPTTKLESLAFKEGPEKGIRLRGQLSNLSRSPIFYLADVWFEELKFNKHCNTFVLFDKKFLILD
jgi:hypothetical protein